MTSAAKKLSNPFRSEKYQKLYSLLLNKMNSGKVTETPSDNLDDDFVDIVLEPDYDWNGKVTDLK